MDGRVVNFPSETCIGLALIIGLILAWFEACSGDEIFSPPSHSFLCHSVWVMAGCDRITIVRAVKRQPNKSQTIALSAGLGDSVGCASDWRSGSRRFDPSLVQQHSLWRLIMKYFLWSFSPFPWFKKGSCQFLAKECAHILFNHLED